MKMFTIFDVLMHHTFNCNIFNKYVFARQNASLALFSKKRGVAFILKKPKETMKLHKKILSRKVDLGFRKLIQIEHNLIPLDVTRLTASQDFSTSLSK